MQPGHASSPDAIHDANRQRGSACSTPAASILIASIGVMMLAAY
jgi:hypothetical protein